MKELGFLNDLISVFEKLPGVGKKTATRYAYYIIEKYNIDDINRVCETLINSFNSIHKCPICGMFTTKDVCEICNDSLRNKKQILVVKDQKDVLSLEKTKQYNGTYHVLGGLISIMDNITPDQLNIDALENRVKNGEVDEIILALALTPSGDITAAYLEKILTKYDVEISRIGYGLPAGSELEYADELTIKRALDYRIKKK